MKGQEGKGREEGKRREAVRDGERRQKKKREKKMQIREENTRAGHCDNEGEEDTVKVEKLQEREGRCGRIINKRRLKSEWKMWSRRKVEAEKEEQRGGDS